MIGLVRDRYADFEPTLAAEKLRELHGLPLGVETLRQWMIADGLRLRRKDRRQRVFQPRPRRACLGELVQIDGSEHWWFEDRGPPCTLLVFIDDATGRLMELRLVETEAAFGYLQSIRAYLAAHGKHARKLAREPVTFYSDKHSIFRISKANAVQGRGMTQFVRVPHDLNIDILAKPAGFAPVCQHAAGQKPGGACEQDAGGPVGEGVPAAGRLQGVCSIEAGNASRAMAELQQLGIVERERKGPRTSWRLSSDWGWQGTPDGYHALRGGRLKSKKAPAPEASPIMFIMENNGNRRRIYSAFLCRFAVRAFYEFGDMRRQSLASIHKGSGGPAGDAYKPFLQHVLARKTQHPREARSDTTAKARFAQRAAEFRLKPNQVLKIVEAATMGRDAFLVVLLHIAGMRIGEARGVLHEDMRRDENVVCVKPHTSRMVPVPKAEGPGRFQCRGFS